MFCWWLMKLNTFWVLIILCKETSFVYYTFKYAQYRRSWKDFSVERDWTSLFLPTHQIYIYTQSSSSWGKTYTWVNTFCTTRERKITYKRKDEDMVREGNPPPVQWSVMGERCFCETQKLIPTLSLRKIATLWSASRL